MQTRIIFIIYIIFSQNLYSIEINVLEVERIKIVRVGKQ